MKKRDLFAMKERVSSKSYEIGQCYTVAGTSTFYIP